MPTCLHASSMVVFLSTEYSFPLIFTLTKSAMFHLLLLRYSFELAVLHTYAAFYALCLVDFVRLLDGAGNRVDGTVARAQRAADTFFLVDFKMKQVLADAGAALLFEYVLLVFVTEIFKSAEHGIGSRLSETAKSVVLDVVAQLSISSRSSIVAVPSVTFVKSSSRRLQPTRQGVHFPQDSSTVNSRKNLAMSTMQLSSSITISPPLPIMDLWQSDCRNLWGRRGARAGMQPPLGPPV